MTEREKLIELLGGKNGFTEEDNDILADYLLEHGVYLLPCKLDDTVYLALKGCKEVVEGKVVRFSIDHKCELIVVIRRKQNNYYTSGNHKWSSFGKTVFLTKEEAEKALHKGD